MGIETLNTNLLKMLSHLSKYPIPDPQMVRDFKWFVKHYNLSVGDGIVTPISGNNVVTVKETTLTFNGGALSKAYGNNPDGFIITPNSAGNLYGAKILIEGSTLQTFSYNNGLGLDVGITVGSEEIVGESLTEGSTPTGSPILDLIKIFCDNAVTTANTLANLSVTIKLYTA
jgi:hypothetical protein